jgi:hypothetical protein
MRIIILFYLAISIISGSIIAYFIKSAPTGYEDEHDFLPGTKEKTDSKSEKFTKAI